MTSAADTSGADVIEAGEYQLYKGLDQIFVETQTLPTTGAVKNRLGLMVMEMDQSLRAFEAGDKAGALQHHEKMLGYSSAVLRETETLSGKTEEAKAAGGRNVAPDVRVLLTTLLTTEAIVNGEKPLDPETKPWLKTLQAVSDAYKAKRAEDIAHITLAAPGAPISEPKKPAAPEAAPFTFGGIEKIILSAEPSGSRFAQAEFAPPTETIWTRREYKNLATVLEGVKKVARDSNTRVQATVAIACLKAINNREIDMLARQRGRRAVEDEDAAKEVKEYAGRLKEYVGKLKDGGTLESGLKANLERFAPPAHVAADGLKRTLGKGSSVIAKAFRFAVAVGKRVFGPEPEHAARPAIAAQKPQEPHGG
ncbi:MAG TPA: hypothetical protein PLW48_00495 [Alphaproteobacteria bacterium]|nr:hypothetical protein [Alphaproteobacteria bacterium]